MTNQSSNITVVVPYYNEQQTITKTLDLLKAQSLSAEVVIFVDSSSTDDSSSIIDSWISRNEQSSHSKFRNYHPGTNTPGGSKAAGVALVTTDLVAFMDCGLAFPIDWLASQARLLENNSQAMWVSGGLVTGGSNIVDKCAIAHTYGYKRFRPVMPSSLLRMDIFNVVGHFKDLRAGYDAQWVRDAHRLGQTRLINQEVVVSYLGTSFAANLWTVFIKSSVYARPTIASGNFVTPLVYLVAATVGVVIAVNSYVILLFLFLGYVTARVALAVRKSRRNIGFFFRPERLVFLILTAIAMDAGKTAGYIRGFVDLPALKSIAKKISGK